MMLKWYFFGFNDIKMRYLEKVSLVICIELYHLVHLNIPNLERRNFEWTDRIFLDIEISRTISNIDISRFEIAYFFNLAHAWVPKLSRGWRHNYSTKTRPAGCTDEQSMYSLMSMLLTPTFGSRTRTCSSATSAKRHSRKTRFFWPTSRTTTGRE
jgi:hypothetical protein